MSLTIVGCRAPLDRTERPAVLSVVVQMKGQSCAGLRGDRAVELDRAGLGGAGDLDLGLPQQGIIDEQGEVSRPRVGCEQARPPELDVQLIPDLDRFGQRLLEARVVAGGRGQLERTKLLAPAQARDGLGAVLGERVGGRWALSPVAGVREREPDVGTAVGLVTRQWLQFLWVARERDSEPEHGKQGGETGHVGVQHQESGNVSLAHELSCAAVHDPRRGASKLAVTWLIATLGCEAGAVGESSTSENGGDGKSTEDDSETGEPSAIGSDCETTELELEAPTSLQATLRHAIPSEIGNSCGATGPIVFARVRVSGRVDLTLEANGRAFDPKLAVLRPGCLATSADDDRLLACGDQLPVSLFDIGPDVELLVAIGIAEDDPALALTPELGELDPLDFELEFTQRAVLTQGQRCGLDQGRCEAGTVCLVVEEDGVEEARCQRPPADSCAAPGTLVLAEPGEVIVLSIPPDEPHSDAHEHECTGWRRPERVDRLELPATLPSDAVLVVRVDDPRVGLALRGSSCAPEDALACTPSDIGSESVLVWGDNGELSALAQAGEAPLLFIELPRSDGALPVGEITVELEIASP